MIQIGMQEGINDANRRTPYSKLVFIQSCLGVSCFQVAINDTNKRTPYSKLVFIHLVCVQLHFRIFFTKISLFFIINSLKLSSCN